MQEPDQTLELKRGDVLLGTLHSVEFDFPWVVCRFEPTQAFEEIKPVFDEELRLLDTDDIDVWEEFYLGITRLGLRLIETQDGNEFSEFLLHIQGNRAWFRA